MAVECVYTRFHSYDFEKDKNFLNGLKTLHMIEEDRGSMLKLKIFFYNRYVDIVSSLYYVHTTLTQFIPHIKFWYALQLKFKKRQL